MQQQSTIARTYHCFLRVAIHAILALLAAGLASPEARSQAFSSLHSFTGPDNGTYPQAALLRGQDGSLYGTTDEGGTFNEGTVFKVNPDGSGFQTLHTFQGSDGESPYAALIQDLDGTLYGTTEQGGANGYGTVFKINSDGSGFQTLYSFTGGSDGAYSYAALFQGQDGALYGTTASGGANGDGSLFKVNTDGSGFQTVHSFSGSDGRAPQAAVIQGQDGVLYGTTWSGGANGDGSLFKVNTDGSGFQTVHSFSGSDGSQVFAGLIQGQDGVLYGTTYENTYNGGTVFKVNPDGTDFQTLFDFGGTAGVWPHAALIWGQDGALYGTTSEGYDNDGTVFKINPDGTAFQTIYSFGGASSEGYWPEDALIQDQDGALYGTTPNGGANGWGTVYRINPDGTGLQILHSFSDSDGYDPTAVIWGQDGALYGTTDEGGTFNEGTVFKVNPDGTGFQTLYNFSYSDGAYPYSGVILGQNGALYGTTDFGGAYNDGTVFKLNPEGTGFLTLHSFNGTSDGSSSSAALLKGQDGTLYGTTDEGGTFNEGTVFKVNPDGTGFQTIHAFSGSNGAYPSAVIQGQDGALYGTTDEGGANGGGTIFKVNVDGSGFQTLHSFSSNGSDGDSPAATVVQGQDGTLYGTTASGGANRYYGTVFKVNTDGTGFQTLHSFSATDGEDPLAALLWGKDGALYGTTYGGGGYGQGTIFKLALLTDVTSKVQVSSSGLTYNAATKLYTGTLIIKNNNQLAIAGPIQAVLTHLPSGVTLVNANGTYNGAPYVTANISSLAPRGLIHLTLQFSVTSGSGRIGYSIKVYSGTP